MANNIVVMTLQLLPLRILLFFGPIGLAAADDYEARCGETGNGGCWCVPPGGIDAGTCPDFAPGIWQSFPSNWPNLYETFQLVDDVTSGDDALAIQPPPLAAADGASPCFPFADAVGDRVNYKESRFPQCRRPEAPDGSTDPVCAYRYDPTRPCRDRDYSMITYGAVRNATDDGAFVVHSGPCGVCSNAKDLAARMRTIDTIESISITCSARHFFNRDFDKLVTCFEGAGLTTPCASLWAHFGVTNAVICRTQCVVLPDNTMVLNDGPPLCGYSSCLSCSADSFEEDFNVIAGLYKSSYNAGFNDAVAYPCDIFTRVDSHDPCRGAPPTASPAPAPSPSSPSTTPTNKPTRHPSAEPSIFPSTAPTHNPSSGPSVVPSVSPSTAPTNKPTRPPSAEPCTFPSTAHKSTAAPRPGTRAAATAWTSFTTLSSFLLASRLWTT